MDSAAKPITTISTRGQVVLPAEVFACLPHRGPPVSAEGMEAAVLAEAKRRHAGD